MRYFIVSQNLLKSDIKLPKHTILRVNLAWHSCLESVREMLGEYSDKDIFLDIPVGRKKPPNHSHDLDDIVGLVNRLNNVKYVAVSNIENAKDVRFYCEMFKCKIVPKIETYKGVMRSASIINALNYKPQIIMLDHEDLFSNMVYLKKERFYLKVINRLIEVCRRKRAHLLRVKGIIFSSDW